MGKKEHLLLFPIPYAHSCTRSAQPTQASHHGRHLFPVSLSARQGPTSKRDCSLLKKVGHVGTVLGLFSDCPGVQLHAGASHFSFQSELHNFQATLQFLPPQTQAVYTANFYPQSIPRMAFLFGRWMAVPQVLPT